MEIPFEVKARRDTGLWNAKLGIWLFLASEVMLFGGLFSSYIFLRLGVEAGVDTPWPMDVQKVLLGFLNTLVLIASSVFVVFAWLALKEGKWRRFQGWMAAVLVCAFFFLGVKSYEYYSKFTHYGMVLTDHSVLEGVVLDNTDKIRFEANSVTIDVTKGSVEFNKWIKKGEHPFFEVEVEGKKITVSNVKSWAKSMRRKVNREIAADRSERWAAKRKNPGAEPLKPKGITRSFTLVSGEPFHIEAKDSRISAYNDKEMSFVDGTKVVGKLLGDTIKFEVHEVDLQMIPHAQQDQAMAWKLINDPAVKTAWDEARNEEVEKLEEYYLQDRERPVPDKQLRSRRVNVHDVHSGGHHEEESHGEHAKVDDGHGDHAKTDDGHGGHAAEKKAEGGHEGIVIEVPRNQKRFLSNHGPAYGTYYAIYFTMTGLHGLHVIGGIIVLGYFMLFGKALYLKDPEHMTNRVEVGGLFWHFVDLVWIFLFPIMYLF